MADRTIGHRDDRAFVAAMLVLLAAAVMFAIGALEMPWHQRKASRLVEHTLEVMVAATALEADIQALSRGDQVQPSAGIARVKQDIAGLQALTTDNPVQQSAIGRLQSLVDDQAWDRASVARQLAVLDDIKAEEKHFLVRREAAADAAAQQTIAFALAGAAILAGGVFFLLFMLLARRRKRILAALSNRNTELEARVAQRTAELADSMARQRSYFENSPNGKVVLRREAAAGRWVHEDLNEAFLSLTGRRREDLLGRSLGEVWPGSITRGAERRLQICMQYRRPLRYVGSHDLGGAVRDLDVKFTPLVQGTRPAQCVLVTLQDITRERDLQREVIRQAELQANAAERETAVFRNSSDILFVVRVEQTETGDAFCYEAFSPSLETATGWRAEDLIGRGPHQTLPPEAGAIAVATYRRCIAAGSTISYTTTYETPLGPREYDGSLTPVRHPASGRVCRLIGGLRDVTERNRLQAALFQAQKMEAIGRLAAGVAHDFNNILQSIFGGLEMVLDELAPEAPAREFASAALRSAERGASLTHHLLSFARKQALLPRNIEVGGLLSDIHKLLARTIGPHISLHVRVDRRAPVVHADPGQLQTALLNLAINAAHAMPLGGTLAIEVRQEARVGRQWVVFAVTDTGTGMDAATLAKAAEPFFTTKGLSGTGLGLSMVHGFAEQSGGSFGIESKLGEGTTVELCLPAAEAAEPDIAAPVREAASPAGRILLVDDDQDVLVAMGAFLEAAGFQVIKAQGGDEALGLLSVGEPIDALVTDYAMPGLNGADLIGEARLVRAGVPAILISGFVEVNNVGALADRTIMLHKPFPRQHLIKALRQVMQTAPTQIAKSTTQR